MTASPDRAALLRQIPSVDELLSRPRLSALAKQVDRALLLDVTRSALDQVREGIARRAQGALSVEGIEGRIVAEIERVLAPSLRPVINATGVILHTNLGRSPLPPTAIEHLRSAATQYSNLEYNVAAGGRGKRDVHTARLLARLVGAEAAIVVNNNAAAVFLVLNTLAKGQEVVVSRGELVEIGDAFRIPDIMGESGALLREVGTTNRTVIADYERAIGERTRLLLRVHPSNFRIVGFTARPSLEEMVELGRRASLPVYEDLGSGCLVDLSPYGFEEPVVRASLQAGASLVSASGDKLLGGPQAGIIAGKRELVERIRKNPLFRALRVDKLTIAALEAVLLSYLRGAYDEIPALRLIRMPVEEIARRAAAFVERLRTALPPAATGEVEIEIRKGFSVIGGGSTPGQNLPTRLIAVATLRHSAAQLEARLRQPTEGMPIVARVEDDRLILDLRTVFPEQEILLTKSLTAALS